VNSEFNRLLLMSYAAVARRISQTVITSCLP
jgi:hypothetical protein